METRSLRLIENWQLSGKVPSGGNPSNVGSVVEFSPATREARVRFPDVATFACSNDHFLKPTN